MTVCPLCRSSALEQINLVSARDLILAYRHTFGMDVAHFFNEPTVRFLWCSSCDLRFFDPVVTGDSVFYERLSASDDYYMDKKPEFEFAKRSISPKDLVLEIGGGKGGFGNSLNPKNYTGLEFNKQAVQVARNAGLKMCLESIEDHATGNRGK